MELIGREEEKQTIIELYESNESSFLAIYGRRRVGKTFLVRKTLSDKITFSYSGKANINRRTLLNSFRLILIKNGLHGCFILKDWFEAFFYLKKIIQESIVQKKSVFIIMITFWTLCIIQIINNYYSRIHRFIFFFEAMSTR